MSQYFHIANNTKKEYLNDHAFHRFDLVGGHGIDFGSILGTPFGSLQLLGLLLSSDVSFGTRPNPEFAGEWQGDSIGMYGDWGSEVDYERVCEEYTDITPRLLSELMTTPFWRDYIRSVYPNSSPTRTPEPAASTVSAPQPNTAQGLSPSTRTKRDRSWTSAGSAEERETSP
jgi:hypothetical protein